ncbi:unnamed protein product, partial [Rotaria sp. Silwood1]
RLNITITGYCRYINLLAVTHNQFEHVASKILPNIGYAAFSFVLHASWETIMSEKAFQILFCSPISLVFPHIQRIILKWFSGERLFTFMDNLNDLSQLIQLDIRGLRADDAKENLRQWFIDHTNLTTNSSFAVKYNENWLDLWI